MMWMLKAMMWMLKAIEGAGTSHETRTSSPEAGKTILLLVTGVITRQTMYPLDGPYTSSSLV
eukprot:5601054-Pyramimonas_sp.AAC.1